MKRIPHRVESKRQPKAPPLPVEVVQTAPREYLDRWGERYLVIWNDQPGDPDLHTVQPNILK